MTTTTSSRGRISVFDHNADVGPVRIPGEVRVTDGRIVVTGSGHNMWLDKDEFHFAWSELDGDSSLTATVHFDGEGVNAHRKAVLLVRDGLDPSARYAGLALHGDGLTSLQYRGATGGLTDEIRFSATAPARLTVRKVGDRVEALVGNESHSVQLPLGGTYYLGVAVCSHVDDARETAEFTDIELTRLD